MSVDEGSALLMELMAERTTARARAAILGDALRNAGTLDVPMHAPALREFIEGPLRYAVVIRLGAERADALIRHVLDNLGTHATADTIPPPSLSRRHVPTLPRDARTSDRPSEPVLQTQRRSAVTKRYGELPAEDRDKVANGDD